MPTHDWLDCFSGLVGMVEGNGGHVVMKNMSFNNSMQELAADETKFAIDRSRCTAGEIPRFRFIVRQ